MKEYGLTALSIEALVYLLRNSFFRSSRKLNAKTAAKFISEMRRKQISDSVVKLEKHMCFKKLIEEWKIWENRKD